MTTEERWAPIPGRPGYEASDQGRIRSIDRIVPHRNGRTRRARGKVLTPQRLPNGYWHLFTGAGNRGYVHRLVLEAFVGPCPDGMEALHGPGGQDNNRLVNLRWGTKSENAQDTVAAGNKAEQKRTHCPARHRLAQPNLVRGELPNRKCKACNRARAWVQRGGDPSEFQRVADAYYTAILEEAA